MGVGVGRSSALTTWLPPLSSNSLHCNDDDNNNNEDDGDDDDDDDILNLNRL